ncbi:MFS general substrate transporter [Hypoxylon sp. EC38]|nr:MFS general substrate transporter [Hypoxylon sp. EC38]
MAQDQEKIELSGAGNSTQAVLNEQQRRDQIQPHHGENNHVPNVVFKSIGEESSLKMTRRKAYPKPDLGRRGLFGRFTIIPEVTKPYDYNDRTKWAMTVIVAVAAATSSTGSSIFYPALSEVAVALNTTPTVTNLSLAFYMLAMSFTPLWWSTYSERLGRRTIYILSFSLFMIFSVPSAVSVNIAMLIVMRILSGGAAASVQAVGAGTVADIWEPRQRGRAMGVSYMRPLCGPKITPIIGGALTQGLGWQSTLGFLVIFGGMLLIMIFFCLPETLAKREPLPSGPEPETNRKSRAQLVIEKSTKVLKGIVDPFKVLEYLRYPTIIISVFSAAIAFGSLYVINISIEVNFASPPYNFNTIEVGLLYLAPTLGHAVASVLGGQWVDYITYREAVKAQRYYINRKLVYLPEDRMKENIWLAALLYLAGMIWYS